MVLACGGPDNTSDGVATTNPDASTSTGTASAGSTSTGDLPTGEGSGETLATGAPDPTTGAGSTSGGSTSGGSTGAVGETGGESSGGESSGGETADGTSGGGDGVVLDPDTLNFFWLPINSLRAGVGGFDEATNTCVTVIFTFDGFQDAMSEHCAFDPMLGFPYVVVTPDAAPPCDQWDYAGNAEVESAMGCEQVVGDNPLKIDIDMTLAVSGLGMVTVKSP